ncbi:MAG: hypothetical protein IMW89_01190 [Ktedonobacteraceae bacterium]|nr:hypothetical protein [Ktedonobacteraceae bacterium]
MAENKAYETIQKLNQSVYEANKTLTQSVVAAQERNMRYAQSIFNNSIELLKSHIDASEEFIRAASEQVQQQDKQPLIQAAAEGAIAAQKRNVQFVQSVIDNGVEVAKSHVEAGQALAQALVERSQEQQEILSSLPYVKAYTDLFYAPLTYHKQAAEATRSITSQALETAQKSAHQGLEFGQKWTQQVMEATLAQSH